LGWSKERIRSVYTATQRSVAVYAGLLWQLKAARVISGAVRSTPWEVVLREAGMGTLEDRYAKMETIKLDRWKHLEEGDHRRELKG
jgi:hypothetical protein